MATEDIEFLLDMVSKVNSKMPAQNALCCVEETLEQRNK